MLNPPFPARRPLLALSLPLALLLSVTAVSSTSEEQATAPPQSKTIIPGEKEILYQFAVLWLTTGYTAEDLLGFLTSGTLPGPTPTPTLGGEPTATPTPTPMEGGGTFDLKDFFILSVVVARCINADPRLASRGCVGKR